MGNPIVNKFAKEIGDRVLSKTLQDLSHKAINSEDPYTIKEPIFKNGIATGKYTTKKRELPEGLSPNNRAVLKKVRKRAHRYDMMFHACCFRFGLGSIIGLFIPFIGDVIDYLLALTVVWKANDIDGGLPLMLKARMMTNIAIDFAIGLVPIVGDIADVFYRANTRNCWILWTYLEAQAKVNAEVAANEKRTQQGLEPRIPQQIASRPQGPTGTLMSQPMMSSQSHGITSAGNSTWGNADLEQGHQPPKSSRGFMQKGRR